MNLEEVFDELKKIEKVYRELILTTNYVKINDSEISWGYYKPGIEKKLYAREYEVLVQNKQYSFLLAEDIGFIQFYFKFLDNRLKKAKLAYYPYPVKVKEAVNDLEDYYDSTGDLVLEEFYYDIWNLLSSELAIPLKDRDISDDVMKFVQEIGIPISENQVISYNFDRKYEITNTSHIRIDFDCAVTSHHQCEIQIGALNELRFPIDKIISPFIFFDFIIKNLGKNSYQGILSKSYFNTDFSSSLKKSILVQDFSENNIYITHL